MKYTMKAIDEAPARLMSDSQDWVMETFKDLDLSLGPHRPPTWRERIRWRVDEVRWSVHDWLFPDCR